MGFPPIDVKGEVNVAERTCDGAFFSYHPLVCLCYFAFVIGVSMFSMHPAVLAISLAGSLAYRGYAGGMRALRDTLALALTACLLPMAINPLFNRAGETVLFRFWWGAPCTLEAVLFGAATGLMLSCVIVWFACYQAVMTSDKVMCLFGRVLPSLSLLFSMVLSFVPRLVTQTRRLERAQVGIGCGCGSGGLLYRLRRASKTVSALATWALEGSVQTADSMRSRGYGTAVRTSYARIRFEVRDASVLAFICMLVLAFTLASVGGAFGVRWYPSIQTAIPGPSYWAGLVFWSVICLLPVAIDGVSEARWSALRSSI